MHNKNEILIDYLCFDFANKFKREITREEIMAISRALALTFKFVLTKKYYMDYLSEFFHISIDNFNTDFNSFYDLSLCKKDYFIFLSRVKNDDIFYIFPYFDFNDVSFTSIESSNVRDYLTQIYEHNYNLYQHFLKGNV